MIPENSERPAPQKLDMDCAVGWILSVGVWLSVSFLAAGMIWHWAAAGNLRFDYAISGHNLFQFLLGAVRPMLVGHFRPELLVNMGIGLLLLTPYLRVVVSVLYFAAARNWKYVVFTGFVFSVLTCSLFLR